MHNHWWNLDKSQRMQLKALAGVLGLLLIVLLMVGRLLIFIVNNQEEPEVHIPVVTKLQNVWIMEVSSEGLLVYQDGEETDYPFGNTVVGEENLLYSVPNTFREQVADITLTDGSVTSAVIKNNKINGKVLSAGSEYIEIEELGRYPIAEMVKGYRLYDSLSMCTVSDITIGYDFNDFIIENGEICAILMVKEEAMEYIRVLLKASDYSQTLHDSITFQGDTSYVIRYGTPGNMAEELHEPGEECTIDPDSAYFQGDRIYLEPTVLTGKITLNSVNRSQGTPSYRGRMELVQTENGIALINEVLLEEYLYSVIPSEMPSSYPEEALKAQAVCARTYAYTHMIKAGYPEYGAHVDDSTSYQVYNNILEQEATTTAAKETYGQLLYTSGLEDLAGTYYYSTSCGVGSDVNVWKTGNAEYYSYLKPRGISNSVMEQVLGREPEVLERGTKSETLQAVLTDVDLIGQAMTEEAVFAEYIKSGNEDDFEYSEAWYRWTYTVTGLDEDYILSILRKRYEANANYVLTKNNSGEFISTPIKELGNITNIYVSKRGSGGIAEELVIETDKNTIKVITEHNIRYVLNNGTTKVIRQDGSEVTSSNLLPSGFFIISLLEEGDNIVGYSLTGGGFGHGVGMSQNAAKAIAASGYQADEILTFFYEGCIIRTVYGDNQESVGTNEQ